MVSSPDARRHAVNAAPGSVCQTCLGLLYSCGRATEARSARREEEPALRPLSVRWVGVDFSSRSWYSCLKWLSCCRTCDRDLLDRTGGRCAAEPDTPRAAAKCRRLCIECSCQGNLGKGLHTLAAKRRARETPGHGYHVQGAGGGR